jgi:hypothetical protein
VHRFDFPAVPVMATIVETGQGLPVMPTAIPGLMRSILRMHAKLQCMGCNAAEKGCFSISLEQALASLRPANDAPICFWSADPSTGILGA